MGLIKTRPRVRVRVPSEIRPGDTFPATVELRCPEAVEVEHVRVLLVGEERWSVGSDKSRVSRSQTVVSLGATPVGATTLPKGVHTYQVRMPLPIDAPPSYRGAAGRIAYELRVEVSIPWWPDRDVAFDIHVGPPARDALRTETQIFSSRPEGPPPGAPHAELGVGSQWTRVGHVVEGAIALSNVVDVRYSEIKLGLRGVESLWDRGAPRYEREAHRYLIRLGAEGAREGEMIPFRFRLPDDAQPELPPSARPGGAPHLVSLAWQLEAVVGVRWGSDLVLRVPYRVLPRSDRPGDAPLRLAPPTVGSDRLRALWEGVGARHGLTYESQSLRARVGETELVVRREHRGRDGVHLLVELRYPDLHLDLEVEPATSVQKMVGGGQRIGDPRWDRDHYVVARDEAQVARVLRRLVPAAANATLHRMDDQHLRVSVRDAGTSRARLERFVIAALELARTLEQVRGALPPPTGFEEALASWRRLAEQIGGSLETARLRVAGVVASLPAEARVAFDQEGAPSATWLGVESPTPLDLAHRAVWHPPLGDAWSGFHPEARQLLVTLTEDATTLEITQRRVTLELPALLGRDASLDAAGAAQRLGRMAQLIQLLRGAAGPYR